MLSSNIVKKRKRIVVFTGGSNSQQKKFFTTAASNFAMEAEFEYFNTADVRKADMTVESFAKRLKSGNGYAMISHPMQGVVDKRYGGGLEWPCTQFAEDLHNFLKDSVGFPEPAKIFDCVFTQDKYVYIEALKEITVPTLRLLRTVDGEMDREMRACVYDFCANHLEVPIRKMMEGGY
jgi:hypothetical protein